MDQVVGDSNATRPLSPVLKCGCVIVCIIRACVQDDLVNRDAVVIIALRAGSEHGLILYVGPRFTVSRPREPYPCVIVFVEKVPCPALNPYCRCTVGSFINRLSIGLADVERPVILPRNTIR